MNKIITMLLILVGVIMVFLFNSLHLENENIILFLIAVFVLGVMSGGFSNLDNIENRDSKIRFYKQEIANQKMKRDELRLDAILQFDNVSSENKVLKKELKRLSKDLVEE